MAPKAEAGGIGGFFIGLLVLLLIAGLSSAVVMLLGDVNQRRFQFRPEGEYLVIERGRLMPPFGFAPFKPKAETLQGAYADIKVPKGSAVGPEIFEERTDLDRALFAVLAGWARRSLEQDSNQNAVGSETVRTRSSILAQATEYIARAELLPGLSEQQRNELRSLRADLAFERGRALIAEIRGLAAQARQELTMALEMGTAKEVDAEVLLQVLSSEALQDPELIHHAPALESPSLDGKSDKENASAVVQPGATEGKGTNSPASPVGAPDPAAPPQSR